MKSFTSLLGLVVLLFASVTSAYAVGSGGLPVRVVFSSSNVTTSAYTQLVASTVKGLSGVSVVNTGAFPVKIAFGPAGSEVDQVVVPPSSSMSPVVYPIFGAYGIRLSVISVDHTNSTGDLEVNLIYN